MRWDRLLEELGLLLVQVWDELTLAKIAAELHANYELQVDGKKRQRVAEFLRGFNPHNGYDQLWWYGRGPGILPQSTLPPREATFSLRLRPVRPGESLLALIGG